MIGNWQIAHLHIHDRFFEYADSYLQAAIGTCVAMEEHSARRNWPNAAVSMLLAAHALELFLKAAILKRSPTENLVTHTLSRLNARYRELYPADEFAFDMPFQTDYIGFTAEEAAALAREEPIPSIMFRYPVDRGLSDWRGVHGFEASSFLKTLSLLNEEFSKLRPRINGA